MLLGCGVLLVAGHERRQIERLADLLTLGKIVLCCDVFRSGSLGWARPLWPALGGGAWLWGSTFCDGHESIIGLTRATFKEQSLISTADQKPRL
jgi:hypothetical protein